MSICPQASQNGVFKKKKALVIVVFQGLSHSSISNWLRIFAVENKPVTPSSQVDVTDMKKDPDKEELLQEIDRLKQELRLKSLDLKRTEMARDAYERMIVLAEERYGIPIRKKSDAK